MARTKGNTKENSRLKRVKSGKAGDYEVGYGKPPKSTQFKPGNPGGPGRPRKMVLSEAYRARLEDVDPLDPLGRTFAMIIADAQIAEALKGNISAAIELRKATEGDKVQIYDWRSEVAKLGVNPDELRRRVAESIAAGIRPVNSGSDRGSTGVN